MSGYKRLVASCGAVALCAAAWLYAASGGRPAHLAGTDCGSCHLAGRAATPAQASKLVASQEVLCGTCHPKAIQVSHPTGMTPRNALPAEYPPDWKGDLTCSSCHLSHGTEPGYLRGAKRGKEMCFACHDAAFFKNMKDSGNSIEHSGHLNAGTAMGTIEMDTYSLHCLGCHDSHSDASGVAMSSSGILRHNSGVANHPIGRRYREAARYGGYRAEHTLSKKILLPEGKLSCVSCHQGYNKDHGKLVMPNTRSALCFQCHDL